MRTQGSLTKWNAGRGFGFIKTRDSGIEVFVHISDFPRSGRTPQIGDILHFEITTGRDGRKQAKSVTFDISLGGAEFTPARTGNAPSSRTPAPREPRRQQSGTRRESSGLLLKVIAGALLLGGAVLGYRKFAAFQTPTVDMSQARSSETATAPTTAPAATHEYVCDGREHCSQMGSCAEAKWVISHCPNTKMDGDSDGIPCEQQLCN